MSKQMSSFVNDVCRKFNDYSTYTQSLIYDFTNSRLEQFQDLETWPELVDKLEITTVSGSRELQLSSFTSTKDYTTENLLEIRHPATQSILRNMTLQRYMQVVPDYTKTQGDPQNIIPVNEYLFYMNPTPSSNAIMTAFFRIRHLTMTAGSQYFTFSDDKVRVLYYGVLADVMSDKNDNRAPYFERLYSSGAKRKASQLYKNKRGQNLRLLPGNSLE